MGTWGSGPFPFPKRESFSHGLPWSLLCLPAQQTDKSNACWAALEGSLGRTSTPTHLKLSSCHPPPPQPNLLLLLYLHHPGSCSSHVCLSCSLLFHPAHCQVTLSLHLPHLWIPASLHSISALRTLVLKFVPFVIRKPPGTW